MPRSSSTQTIARQWEMLKRLPTRTPGISSRELTEWLSEQGHPVSKRTVERDLNELSRVFAIRCDQDNSPYLWFWMKDAQLDFGSVELSDAVSLTLAEQLLKEMLPASMLKLLEPKFTQARKKLSALEKNPLSRLTEKVRYYPTHLDMQPPSLRSNIVEAVQKALVEQKQLRVRYARFNDNARDMTLNPLVFVQRGPVPYLVATVENHGDPRIFALHRFETIKLTEAASKSPKDFNIDDYLESGALHFGSGKTIKLKAKLSEKLASYLTETPISEDQKIVYRKDAWILKASVHDSWQLKFWILSKGPDLTVQSPKALKLNIQTLLNRAANNYISDSQ